MPNLQYDLIILGGGASGLMAAINAQKLKLKVAIIEQAQALGSKIAISGGGKCNFSNINISHTNYISDNTEFCIPALKNFTTKHILNYLKQHNIQWEEREHGRLFCKKSAQDLIDALDYDCKQAHIPIFLNTCVQDICSTSSTHKFSIKAKQAHKNIDFKSHALILALGSPAFPQSGASNTGAICAKLLGHRIKPIFPVLTPLYMPSDWALHGLNGISLKVSLKIDSHSFTDSLLFTHKGLSGPVILQASCYWKQHMPLEINFLPHMDFYQLLDLAEHGKTLSKNLLTKFLSQRLAKSILPPLLADKKIAELSRAQRKQIAQYVHAYTIIPYAAAGLHKAEACAGGISVLEVNPHTMESLITPKLYLCGEVLDVAGQLGGYNLHWAWASGTLAGNKICL